MGLSSTIQSLMNGGRGGQVKKGKSWLFADLGDTCSILQPDQETRATRSLISTYYWGCLEGIVFEQGLYYSRRHLIIIGSLHKPAKDLSWNAELKSLKSSSVFYKGWHNNQRQDKNVLLWHNDYVWWPMLNWDGMQNGDATQQVLVLLR